MTEALVNREVVRWARERAGLDIHVAARKLGTRAERVASWERGETRPTFRQAKALAKITHVPFGYLFLAAPPKDDLPIPDLRGFADGPPPPLDANFLDLIRDVRFKVDWYRDYRIDHGAEALPFVGRFSLDASVTEVAADMARTLEVDAATRTKALNWEAYLLDLIDKAERQGVWVMRSGVVGNNTNRRLNKKLFRGFAISDSVVPVVFLNGQDAKAAQVFTLGHELAHIWVGRSGVSDPFRESDAGCEENQRLEAFCNRVAAEFLLPRSDFDASWRVDQDLDSNADVLKKQFRVSRIVVAMRALELGRIDRRIFETFFQQEKERWKRDSRKKAGGNYYNNVPLRNGPTFTRAVLSAAMSNKLLLRDAAALLNMNVPAMRKLYLRQEENSQ